MTDPLLDLAMSYVRANVPRGLPDESYRLVRDAFEQYLAGALGHDHLAVVLYRHLGTIQRLDRMDTILQVRPEPPPALWSELASESPTRAQEAAAVVDVRGHPASRGYPPFRAR